jgi:uncharacterized protein (DUF1684 family)
LKWYAPDADYKVTAKWVPYNPGKKVSLITLIGTSYDQPVPGYAEFTLQGKSYRLEPVLEDPQSTKLFFILKDPTSDGHDLSGLPILVTLRCPAVAFTQEGELVLDFNHLGKSALRLHSLCHLPAAACGQPAARSFAGRRTAITINNDVRISQHIASRRR